MPFKTVEEILQSDTPSNIFSFCRCQDLIIFSYFGKEDTRIETIYSTRQGLLYNGPVGLDSNGMPVSIASYINRSTERQYLLSMVNPEAMRFFYNKRKGNENYPILNNIGTNLGSNGNPALIFYKIRDERTQ